MLKYQICYFNLGNKKLENKKGGIPKKKKNEKKKK